MQIPSVQEKIAERATVELSNLLGVPVKIGHVNIGWINRLVLEDIYLEDQSGMPMLEASHISAGFKLLPLFKRKMVFTTVRLFGFSVHLRKADPQSPLNLQFLLDAFASKDSTKKNPNIELRFNSILLRRGHFHYDIASEPATPGKFNARHVDVKNITAKMSLKAFTADSLNASINRLSLEESSGLKIRNLSAQMAGNKESVTVKNLELLLPKTSFKIMHAGIKTAGIDSLSQLFNAAPIDLEVSPSQIYLQDLSALVPAFRYFTDRIDLSAHASGTINDIHVRNLKVNYDNEKIALTGNTHLKDVTTPQRTYLHGEVSRLHITEEGLARILKNFGEKPIKLPEEVSRLGDLDFKGEISGLLDNLIAYGELKSAIGSVQTDLSIGRDKARNIALALKGKIASTELQVDRLFKEGNPYGKVRFSIELDVKRPSGGNFSGYAKAAISKLEYKGYEYKNIQISGDFNKNEFDGILEVNDENVQLYAEGMFNTQHKNPAFNFSARVRHFRPDKLHLLNKDKETELAFSLQADFTGNNIDNLEGSIRMDSLSFHTASGNFELDRLLVEASGHSGNRGLSIHSQLLNGEITGAYSFSGLTSSLLRTTKHFLPSLIETKQGKEKKKANEENNFNLSLTIQNTEALSNALQLPVTILNGFRLVGEYNDKIDRFRFEGFLPKYRLGKSDFESGYFIAENRDDKATLQLRMTQINNKGVRNYFEIKGDAANDKINTLLSWENSQKSLYKGELSASAVFVKEENEKQRPFLRTEITMNEGSLIVNDSIWKVEPASITITKGNVRIDNFYISRKDQHLRIDGVVSDNAYETMSVELKDIELSYIFDIINIKALAFGGRATGTFHLNDLYHSRIINTDLEVEHFSFNQVEVGRLNLFSEWDNEQQGILMLGSIYKNDTTWTDVNGYIFPVGEKEGLSLYFDANDINIAFLQPFVQTVAKNIQGNGSGKVHLFGPFSDLTVEGDAYIREGGFGIDFTGTYYTFSDSIHMTPSSIRASNLTLYDSEGNKGTADLTVNHHNFEDLSFHINVLANQMLLYDVTEKKNPQIHGKAYGSGSAVIKGNEKLVDLDVSMQSNPNTKIYLNFMDATTAEEYDFIQFVNKDTMRLASNDSTANSSPGPRLDTSTEIRMNFNLDVTPDAQIEFMMDPASGDKIIGNGSGNLQIQYGTRSNLAMFGGLTIQSGNYDFSMQQIIHKDFKIREGSTINFHGDPNDANLNINAIYNVTANLGDLDQSLLIESARTNIPVNCVLLIEGRLQNPSISFNLELPSSTEELEQKVKAYVDTEDMMTRQIVYLLVLNKFYTPDYSKNTTRSSEFSAVASSAVSSQLSEILSSFTDKVQIGTNIRASQDGVTDTEVEMLLSSQLLDNRLLINGNIGYKNNTFQQNAFIGEFDMEYKLTRRGDIRLKAYNHANDMYRYKQTALTKQGIGIMYRKDFTDFSDLFQWKKSIPVFALPPDTIPNGKKDSIPLKKDGSEGGK